MAMLPIFRRELPMRVRAAGAVALALLVTSVPVHGWGLDVHRFITPALRAVGFTDSRIVHRLALALRAGIGGPR